MKIPSVILASSSSARLRLLKTVGINPIVMPSNFDESTIKLKEPRQLVETLAQAKAETIANSIMKEKLPEKQSNLILGCDSVLVIEDQIYGKPNDKQEAITRWQKMRGQVGQLYTGHALIDLSQNKTIVLCRMTKVHFSHVNDQEIEAYVATEEPLKCAGCFAIDGIGGLFIEKIDGCHTNVIGLSLPLFRVMLNNLGYQVSNFW
ncbi:maf protein [Trichodesmium erythraeum IMS101]|uniref:Nucleoside triphosphate pyrophosphatase n=1 Tax=Trichodesmium erythraeum (strain IMS101) TaxID=203124 RepID=NTPP_TRIEI|nr:RecName: Full=Nucleoside triphosphate pyrophosphatase; AltName: Full=Nucleotide pyrophosphatase; Short=Nucleotide PPase [Trichodesmium erythraeum IMS101]MBS9772659.1 septum formation inhibitor Maf [Trichodesmium erythraeum GBRTRLIN201]